MGQEKASSPRLKPFSKGPLSRSGVPGGSFPTGSQEDANDTIPPPDAACDGPDDSAMDDGLQLENADLLSSSAYNASYPEVASLDDLALLRAELGGSDRVASSVTACLRNMALLSKTMPRKQLWRLHKDPLMVDVVELMDANMHQFTARPLALCLWSLANLQYIPGRVMTKMTKAVDAHVDDFDTCQLVNVIWSFGKLSMHPGSAVLQRMCDRFVLLLPDLTPQGLSNVAWACARLGVAPKQLLTGLAAESASRLHTFSPQGVSNLCWAFAKLSEPLPPGVLAAIERHAVANFPAYSCQAITLVFYGLAKQGAPAPSLTSLVSTELQSCSQQFAAEDLVAVMVAFAMMDYRHSATLKAGMQQCINNLPLFRTKPELLCSILWAVGQLRVRTGRSFAHRVIPHIMETMRRGRGPRALPPGALSNLCFAIGALRVKLDTKRCLYLVDCVLPALPFMDAKQLAGVCVGFPFVSQHSKPQQAKGVAALQASAVTLMKNRQIKSRELLHILSCMLKSTIVVLPSSFMYAAISHLIASFRSTGQSAVDVAQAAHVIGKWRGGPRSAAGPQPVVQEMVDVIEDAAAEAMRGGNFTPRQLANVEWMFGRLSQRPSLDFTQLSARMLIERTDEFNHVDMANVMYAFTAASADPGLDALEAVAGHVNERYAEYGQAEMAQVLYAFARLSFHPGAVVGRVLVVYSRKPELFDSNAYRLLSFALPALEGNDNSVTVLGSHEFDSPSDDVVAAVVARSQQSKRRSERDLWRIIASQEA